MTYELTSLDPLTIRGKHAGGEQWWKYENGEWWHCCDHKGPWVNTAIIPDNTFDLLLARLRDAEAATEKDKDAIDTLAKSMLAARSDLAASKAEVERLRGLLSEWYGCREYFLCDEGLVARTRAALTPAPAQPVSEPYKLPAPAAVPAVCECGHRKDAHAFEDETAGPFCDECRCGKFRPAPAKEVQGG